MVERVLSQMQRLESTTLLHWDELIASKMGSVSGTGALNGSTPSHTIAYVAELLRILEPLVSFKLLFPPPVGCIESDPKMNFSLLFVHFGTHRFDQWDRSNLTCTQALPAYTTVIFLCVFYSLFYRSRVAFRSIF